MVATVMSPACGGHLGLEQAEVDVVRPHPGDDVVRAVRCPQRTGKPTVSCPDRRPFPSCVSTAQNAAVPSGVPRPVGPSYPGAATHW
jgi:hypothetical protein